jgi:feruloyl esterase
VNALALLQNWVLRGQIHAGAPTACDLSLTDMSFIRSMPACRFPAYPQYDGRGDPNQASSFQCVARLDHPLSTLK